MAFWANAQPLEQPRGGASYYHTFSNADFLMWEIIEKCRDGTSTCWCCSTTTTILLGRARCEVALNSWWACLQLCIKPRPICCAASFYLLISMVIRTLYLSKKLFIPWLLHKAANHPSCPPGPHWHKDVLLIVHSPSSIITCSSRCMHCLNAHTPIPIHPFSWFHCIQKSWPPIYHCHPKAIKIHRPLY